MTTTATNVVLLREAREEAGLTQRELAAEIGSFRGTVYNWETGRCAIPVGQLRKIANVTGVPANRLYVPVNAE